MMMERGIPRIPHVHMSCVDVRDVAAAHISAMTAPQAAGKSSKKKKIR